MTEDHRHPHPHAPRRKSLDPDHDEDQKQAWPLHDMVIQNPLDVRDWPARPNHASQGEFRYITMAWRIPSLIMPPVYQSTRNSQQPPGTQY